MLWLINVFRGGITFPGLHYGEGTGPIWMDGMNCTGYEQSLFDCPFNGWAIQDCTHEEDAGVICGPFSGTVTPPTTPQSTGTCITHHESMPVYNFDPLKPHFYIVKLGFTRVSIIFFIFLLKT